MQYNGDVLSLHAAPVCAAPDADWVKVPGVDRVIAGVLVVVVAWESVAEGVDESVIVVGAPVIVEGPVIVVPVMGIGAVIVVCCNEDEDGFRGVVDMLAGAEPLVIVNVGDMFPEFPNTSLERKLVRKEREPFGHTYTRRCNHFLKVLLGL